MPSYKYNPNKENPRGLFFTTFEVYNPETKSKRNERILYGQTFMTDSYLPDKVIEKEELEFISDEPYVSPIICSYTGNNNNDLIVPENNTLLDVYVSVLNGYIKLYFNNNKIDNDCIMITPQSSGTIFRSISNNKIRVINTISFENALYTISLLNAEQFAGNNGTQHY